MKKFIFILMVSIPISFDLSAQSAGDYRSIASGAWNDPTKWERYDGTNWITTTTYPGQNSGTGAVTIMKETEIKVSVNIPYPITSLTIRADNPTILTTGVLAFNASTAVTLTVSGDVAIWGQLRIDDQTGAKTHTLVIGHNLVVGDIYDYNCNCYVSIFILMSIEFFIIASKSFFIC